MCVYGPDAAQNRAKYFNFGCREALLWGVFWVWGHMEERGYFLGKQKLCLQSLAKQRKQPAVVILQQSIFLQYIYLVLVAKNH